MTDDPSAVDTATLLRCARTPGETGDLAAAEIKRRLDALDERAQIVLWLRQTADGIPGHLCSRVAHYREVADAIERGKHR